LAGYCVLSIVKFTFTDVGWRERRRRAWNYRQSILGCWYWWTTFRFGAIFI